MRLTINLASEPFRRDRPILVASGACAIALLVLLGVLIYLIMGERRDATACLALARELGVRLIACEMSRDLMGIKESELIAGLECGGVASFLADSLRSRTSLFI